ncbi:AcrR family transcriptional regulator [Sphingobium xenophagum]|uniref:AcrR family transcriptional regulator n=1 Tax=Sphingobium xenophagum TaxID=121428 RepID=A0ABU1X6L9_SPHXE|nr:TetR/AcrR family transcriptional regulator [Sphingobium xenophagum]MDR7156692.1 AcrR family transcriptional regulator [Sphingobium xenophagum]
MINPSPAVSRRSAQQRAIKTRTALLEAALGEFAEHGFEGASIRGIGQRAGLEYTLIKYHFSDKETLWRSTAAFAFEKIYSLWEEAIPPDSDMTPAERVAVEFRTLLRFTVEYPDFHRFMERENSVNSPRLEWLATEMLKPTRDRILPQIIAAQQDGEIIQGDPAQVYHMLVGMATALASQQGEMAFNGFKLTDHSAVDAYWNLVQRVIFPRAEQGRRLQDSWDESSTPKKIVRRRSFASDNK